MSARSSDSIRHIAKALAAAQREFQNPQARHDGQIRRELPSGLALIEPYRFASLGDGLALIRPVLGRYGLSVIQATRLDTQTALLILETRIIHESGEWILADYPVAEIPQGGVSDPRELGAALTYARRQSLFSLIGIAPQNDTDGLPGGDIPVRVIDASSSTTRRDRRGHVGDHSTQRPQASVNRAIIAKASDPAGTETECEPSQRRRSSEEALQNHLDELERLSSQEELRMWAIQRVKALGRLLPQDRQRLNEAFQARRRSCGPPSQREHDGLQPPVDETSPPALDALRAKTGARKPSSGSTANPSPMTIAGACSPHEESSRAAAPIFAAEGAQS